MQKRGKGQFLASFSFGPNDVNIFEGFDAGAEILGCEGYDAAAVKIKCVKKNAEIPDPVELSVQDTGENALDIDYCMVGYPENSI